MFFSLCIYIISTIFIQKINSFTVNYRYENTQSTELHITNSNVPEILKNDSVIFKQKLIFQANLNLTHAPNLKYNVFDKMLSNEMLSIKHHLFVKNSTSASSVYISLQNNVPTPTLELNQKWPIGKLLANVNKERHTDDTESKQSSYLTKGTSSTISEDVNPEFDTDNRNKDYNPEKNYTDYRNADYNPVRVDADNRNDDYNPVSKVIEVRSFSVMPVHNTNNLRSKSLCTCMKINQDTSCTQHCTATGEHYRTQSLCTHSDKYINCQAECTRHNFKNIIPFTPYPYVYPSYFLGVPTLPATIYYHPDVINELKVPKHKHQYYNNKLPYNYQFFGDGDDIKEDNDVYLENEKDDSEEIFDKKCKNKKKYKYNPKTHSDKFNTGLIEVIEKDKFVDEVIEDLKTYYSDAVIKDCYCSLSTLKLKFTANYFMLTFFVVYIM